MNTSITARHCEISDELRQRAGAVLDRLAGLMNRPVDGTVVFDLESGQATAEIRLQGASGLQVATAAEKDHRTALDRAEDKVRRQLDKTGAGRRGKKAKDVA